MKRDTAALAAVSNDMSVPVSTLPQFIDRKNSPSRHARA